MTVVFYSQTEHDRENHRMVESESNVDACI